MKIKLILFSVLTALSSEINASMLENITASMGEIVLKPGIQQSDAALLVKSVDLPALCTEKECKDGGIITMYDGSILPLDNGKTRYSAILKGLDVSVNLSSETADALRNGRGGTVEIAVRQGHKPYHSGPFNLPLMTYASNGPALSEGKRIGVNLDGVVSSGSCEITGGKDLSFSLFSTQNEFRQLGNSRKLIESKVIEFDCVNVSSMSIRFSSGNMKQDEPSVLYDDTTGVGVILGYAGAGKQGDIRWDNSELTMPIDNDTLSVAINLYAREGKVSPGNFTFTGIYQAEYH